MVSGPAGWDASSTQLPACAPHQQPTTPLTERTIAAVVLPPSTSLYIPSRRHPLFSLAVVHVNTCWMKVEKSQAESGDASLVKRKRRKPKPLAEGEVKKKQNPCE